MVVHRVGRLAACLVGIVLLAVGGAAHAARDIHAAQAEVDAAKLAIAAKHYAEAAEHMDKAYAFDPNPLWLANAGFARMMAGQQERAVEALSSALGDKNLQGEARTRAVERLGKASAAKAFIQRSEEAKTRGDLEAAARAFDEAYASVQIGPYALESGTLWERVGSFQTAQDRYSQAAAAQDLTPDQQRQTVEALARVARLAAQENDPTLKPHDEKGDKGNKNDKGDKGDKTANLKLPNDPIAPVASSVPVAGWVCVGTGVAAIGAGLTVLFVGNGKAADLQSAQDGADGDLVRGMSRQEALALSSDAKTFQVAGLVTAIVGGALATTGVVLIATHGPSTPETHGTVKVGSLGAAITRDGWMVTTGLTF